MKMSWCVLFLSCSFSGIFIASENMFPSQNTRLTESLLKNLHDSLLRLDNNRSLWDIVRGVRYQQDSVNPDFEGVMHSKECYKEPGDFKIVSRCYGECNFSRKMLMNREKTDEVAIRYSGTFRRKYKEQPFIDYELEQKVKKQANLLEEDGWAATRLYAEDSFTKCVLWSSTIADKYKLACRINISFEKFVELMKKVPGND